MNNTEKEDFSYVSFWTRLWASLIDSMLFILLSYPLYFLIYGKDFLFNPPDYSSIEIALQYLFVFVIILLFWFYKMATPGKIVFKAKIVDATTHKKASLKQYVIRYIGYYISIIPLGLGYLWVLWDKKNQALHDKLAHTVVIGPKREIKKISFFGYIARGIAIFFITVILILFISFVTIGLLLKTEILIEQDDRIYSAKQLDDKIFQKLIQENIIDNEQELQYLKTDFGIGFSKSDLMIKSGVAVLQNRIVFYEESATNQIYAFRDIENIEYESDSQDAYYDITIELSDDTEYIFVDKNEDNLKAIESIVALWEKGKHFKAPETYSKFTVDQYSDAIQKVLQEEKIYYAVDIILNGYQQYANSRENFFKYNDKIFELLLDKTPDSHSWLTFDENEIFNQYSFDEFLEQITYLDEIKSNNKVWEYLVKELPQNYLYFIDKELNRLQNSNIAVEAITLYQEDGTTIKESSSSRQYIVSKVYEKIAEMCDDSDGSLCSSEIYLKKAVESSSLNPNALFLYAYELDDSEESVALLETLLEIIKISDELFDQKIQYVYNNLGYDIYNAKQTKKYDKALSYLEKAYQAGEIASLATISSIYKEKGDYKSSYNALKPIAYQLFHALDKELKEKENNYWIVVRNLISTSYEIKDYNTAKYICNRYLKLHDSEDEKCQKYSNLTTLKEKPLYSFWELYTHPEEYEANDKNEITSLASCGMVSSYKNSLRSKSTNIIQSKLLEKFTKLYSPLKVPNTLQELIKIEEYLGTDNYVTSFFLTPDDKVDFFECIFECDDQKLNNKISEFFLPLARIDGTGGIAAFWLKDGENSNLEDSPIVAFGSEGAINIVAKNIKDFLFMLSFGSEAMDGEFYQSTNYAEAYYKRPKFMEYRAWLKDVMNIEPVEDWRVDGVPKEISILQKEAQKLYSLKLFKFLSTYLPNRQDIIDALNEKEEQKTYENDKQSLETKKDILKEITKYEKLLKNINILGNKKNEYYENIAELYYKMGENEKAITYYEKILQNIDPKKSWQKKYVYRDMSKTYEQNGDYENAIVFLKKVVTFVDKKFDLAEYYFHMSDLYQKLNNDEEALFYARKAYVFSEVDSDLYYDSKKFIKQIIKQNKGVKNE